MKWLSDIIKITETCVPHMVAPRRGCLDYSKVYCDVRKRCFLAWNQNRHITYYILHIQYTNSEIITGPFYIRPHFVWRERLNHCAALVRNLLTSMLVRALVCLLSFHTHTSTLLAQSWFTNFEGCRFQNFSISMLSCLADSSCMAWSKLSKVLSSSFKIKTSVSIKN